MTFRCRGNVARFPDIERATPGNERSLSVGFRLSSRKRIFLTGPAGCGKTTVVWRVAALLPGGASGVFTEYGRDAGGQRVGFRAVSLVLCGHAL